MGSLQRFDLRKYADHYGLSVFFETGTFQGHGVERAIEAGFEQILSVEIIEEFYTSAAQKFRALPRVKIIHGESITALGQNLAGIEGNIFFWLDAHFPGADGGLMDYNSVTDEAIRYPLQSELEAIARQRPKNTDVILIDDLRIYEDGEYASGNMPSRIIRPITTGTDFVSELFGDTHHLLKLNYDEGYLLLLPNSTTPQIFVQRMFSETSFYREIHK